MGIVVIGAVFVDIKGFPDDAYILMPIYRMGEMWEELNIFMEVSAGMWQKISPMWSFGQPLSVL